MNHRKAMNEPNKIDSEASVSRRQFLKNSSLATAGAVAAVNFPAVFHAQAKQAIEVPGVNYVIIATPPGFKATQFKAAVEAGKHVFTEKPVAVDGPGCRI